MTDQSAEFIRYRDCCTSAATALQSGNFSTASDLFNQALEMARMYSPRSTDEAYCLQGLADSYFGQYKFIESKSTYLQLEQLLESWGETVTERRFAISMQIAKCMEKMHEFDQACSIYSKTLEVIEVTLPYGDQKLTNFLETYANALRSARKDPQKLAEIEQKVRLSRSKQSNPQFLSSITTKGSDTSTKNAVTKEPTELRMRKTEVVDFSEPEAKASALQTFTKEHPRLTMVCLFGLLTIVVQAMALVSAIDEIKGKTPPPPSSPAAVGNLYQSVDGKETLQFLEHGKVAINGAAGTTNARCYVASPGWSEFIATMLMQKPNQVWLVPDAGGLRDASGQKHLYNLKTSPVMDIPPRLTAVAKACLIYILQYKKYPDANTLVATVPGILDKMSDGKEYPPVIVAGNKETMTKDLHTIVNNRSIELVHDKLAASKVVCMTLPEALKMIIVATDSSGAPFKSQLGVQLAIAVTDGELIPTDGLNTKIAFFGRLPNSVVISASAPEFIKQLYVRFLVLICVAIPLVIAGLKLKTLKIVPSREEGSLSLRLKVLAWLGWGALTIVWLYQLEETCSAYLFRG